MRSLSFHPHRFPKSLLFSLVLPFLICACSPYAQLKGQTSQSEHFIAIPFSAILDEHMGILQGPDTGVMSFNPQAEERPYRTQVRFIGLTRPIPEIRWDMVQFWGRFFRVPVSFTRQFSHEIAIESDGYRYWVPLRSEVLDQFLRDVSTGESFELWTMLIGAVKEDGQFSHLFLMNNYQIEE